MIAGHSNGQPSRKMQQQHDNQHDTGRQLAAPSIVSVIQFAVPRRANTAPKMFDVTASSSTMLDVAIVEISARCSPASENLP